MRKNGKSLLAAKYLALSNGIDWPEDKQMNEVVIYELGQNRCSVTLDGHEVLCSSYSITREALEFHRVTFTVIADSVSLIPRVKSTGVIAVDYQYDGMLTLFQMIHGGEPECIGVTRDIMELFGMIDKAKAAGIYRAVVDPLFQANEWVNTLKNEGFDVEYCKCTKTNLANFDQSEPVGAIMCRAVIDK